MKNFFFSAFIVAFVHFSIAQDGVGIGITAPDESAILHVDAPSDNKGMLVPRLTTAQRNNIVNPAEGLIIYNETIDAFDYYDGSSWVRLIPTPAKFNINMSNNKITNLADGTNAGDGVNRGQLDDLEAKHDAFETTVQNYALLENRTWVTLNLNTSHVTQISGGSVTEYPVQAVSGTLKYADMGPLCWFVELSFEATARSDRNIDELRIDFSSLPTALKTAFEDRAGRIPGVIRRTTGTGEALHVVKIARWYPAEEKYEIEPDPMVSLGYDSDATGTRYFIPPGDSFKVYMSFFISK
ncbi:hypothetical protein [Ekhidna sp.]|uniref:hypothetical protein n=1 Tax=Ekhidna sp. TaxID=2608089 RepID=UPI003517B020